MPGAMRRILFRQPAYSGTSHRFGEIAMHRILVTLLLWACALVASAAEPQSLKAYHGNTGHPAARVKVVVASVMQPWSDYR